jgi:hypothetical protein
MGDGSMAAWRRRARARGERPEAGERRWRRRWVKRAWEKECCGRWPADFQSQALCWRPFRQLDHLSYLSGTAYT